MVGLVVAAGVLLAAAAGGLLWRRQDGRLREWRPRQSRMALGARQAAGAPAAATGPDSGRVPAAGPIRLSVDQLGQPLGERATLLQFSSAFCAPCRAARVLLADIAARTAGVTHLDLDVSAHMDLVRRLDVRRTPTLFVLGPGGEISVRASGVPRRDDVTAVVSRLAAAPGLPAPGAEGL